MLTVDELRTVVAESGPFASVYVDASHDTEDAARRTELLWQSIRTELAELGADQQTRDAIGAALVDEPPVGTAGRALIAAGGRVLTAETLPLPPATEHIRVAAQPYLVPLMNAARRAAPYVIAEVDRVGANFFAVNAAGAVVTAPKVHGQEHPVHQPRGGGWSHRSIRNHVAETVKHNITDIAEHAAKLADQVGAEVLAISGEVQARTAVREALPRRCQEIAVELDSPDRIDELLAQRQAATEQDAVERFRAGHGRGDAVDGLGPVAEALRGGQVQTLLVSDPLLGNGSVWRGPDPSQVATDPGELPELAGRLIEARADEAFPVAAVATGADVLVVADQDSFTDGIGALLRYPAQRPSA